MPRGWRGPEVTKDEELVWYRKEEDSLPGKDALAMPVLQQTNWLCQTRSRPAGLGSGRGTDVGLIIMLAETQGGGGSQEKGAEQLQRSSARSAAHRARRQVRGQSARPHNTSPVPLHPQKESEEAAKLYEEFVESFAGEEQPAPSRGRGGRLNARPPLPGPPAPGFPEPCKFAVCFIAC